jgi:hypothetical protein
MDNLVEEIDMSQNPIVTLELASGKTVNWNFTRMWHRTPSITLSAWSNPDFMTA